MSNEAQVVSNLNILTTSSANTKLVVSHTYANGLIETLRLPITNSTYYVPGPYANDAVANTNGVSLKSIYYDASGVIHIRLS